MMIKDDKKILLVSHCIINGSSKVESFTKNTDREEARKKILRLIIDEDIDIIQLPCPEILIYGVNRWGHVREQFDTPHFRSICRKELLVYIHQIQEYISKGYEIIGILGIDGSPSCGVDLTCSADWGGEIGSNPKLNDTINSLRYINDRGIFMEELENMLEKNNINIKMLGFSLQNIDKIHEIITK